MKDDTDKTEQYVESRGRQAIRTGGNNERFAGEGPRRLDAEAVDDTMKAKESTRNMCGVLMKND